MSRIIRRHRPRPGDVIPQPKHQQIRRGIDPEDDAVQMDSAALLRMLFFLPDHERRRTPLATKPLEVSTPQLLNANPTRFPRWNRPRCEPVTLDARPVYFLNPLQHPQP
jgi:hypothetical protein